MVAEHRPSLENAKRGIEQEADPEVPRPDWLPVDGEPVLYVVLPGLRSAVRSANPLGFKGRINLIGTLSLHGKHKQLEARRLGGSCNQAQVMAYLETLAESRDPKHLTVVFDNALFHKGEQIKERRARWEARDLFLAIWPPTAHNST